MTITNFRTREKLPLAVTRQRSYFQHMGAAYQINDQHQAHFLTFQVVGWADVFSRQAYRDIILDSITYCRKAKGLLVFAYVVMTNHVHVIFQSERGQLSDTVRDFKRHTSTHILEAISNNPQESRKAWLEMVFRHHAKYNKRSSDIQFWTHENHAVVLDTDSLTDSRLTYIHYNPVRAGWVANPEDYLYSSARNYADLDALIEVDFL